MTRKVSQVFTLSILAIALIAAGVWLFRDASQSMRILSSILIVACPCALALSAPFAFGTALRVLRPYGLYLKNGFVVEGMARVRHLAFDKTGTLTHGGLGTVTWQGQDHDPELFGWIRGLAGGSTHPLSRAIAASIDVPEHNVERIEEHPGKGIEGWGEERQLRLGSGAWLKACGLTLPETNESIQSWVAVDDQVIGGYRFEDAPREGMEASIPALKRRYDLSVLTGDRAAGLEKLQTWFPGCADARPELSPADKLEAIDQLRSDGKAVMMLGDGLNDAGALRHSDVGVAVTEDIHAFSPACDAILDAKNLYRLPHFLRFSQLTTKVVMVSFTISLLYNVVGISIAASGYLSPLIAAILMPLSSVTVLLISVLGTRMAAKLAGLKSNTMT